MRQSVQALLSTLMLTELAAFLTKALQIAYPNIVSSPFPRASSIAIAASAPLHV